MGYIGSVTLLLICLAFIMGIGSHLTKWAFVLVGVWWVSEHNRLPQAPSNRTTHDPRATCSPRASRNCAGWPRT